MKSYFLRSFGTIRLNKHEKWQGRFSDFEDYKKNVYPTCLVNDILNINCFQV